MSRRDFDLFALFTLTGVAFIAAGCAPQVPQASQAPHEPPLTGPVKLDDVLSRADRISWKPLSIGETVDGMAVRSVDAQGWGLVHTIGTQPNVGVWVRETADGTRFWKNNGVLPEELSRRLTAMSAQDRVLGRTVPTF